jgi:hypothetical protein
MLAIAATKVFVKTVDDFDTVYLRKFARVQTPMRALTRLVKRSSFERIGKYITCLKLKAAAFRRNAICFYNKAAIEQFKPGNTYTRSSNSSDFRVRSRQCENLSKMYIQSVRVLNRLQEEKLSAMAQPKRPFKNEQKLPTHRETLAARRNNTRISPLDMSAIALREVHVVNPLATASHGTFMSSFDSEATSLGGFVLSPAYDIEVASLGGYVLSPAY